MASAALQKARAQLDAVKKSASKRVASVQAKATSVGAIAGGAAIAGAISGAGLDVEVAPGYDVPVAQFLAGLALVSMGGSMTVKQMGQGMLAGATALLVRDASSQALGDWMGSGDDGEDD
jgi:hypothetical protein